MIYQGIAAMEGFGAQGEMLSVTRCLACVLSELSQEFHELQLCAERRSPRRKGHEGNPKLKGKAGQGG